MPKTQGELAYRTCPFCEATCGLELDIDRSTATVHGVRGDDADPLSGGFLCPKAYGLKELHEDPDRLRAPLRKVGDRFEEIGWEEAFDLAATRLAEIRDAHGADAIGTYFGNPTVHNLGASIYGRALLFALGTKWRFSASSVDQLPKMLSSAAMFGGPLSIAVPDLDRTDFLLILGANPLVSNGSLLTAPAMPKRLRAIQERGGSIVVVDPRRSETAELADRHLAIRPGGDAFLLLAMVQVLFEEDLVTLGRLEDHVAGVDELRAIAADFPPEAVEAATGLPAEDIRELARDFAAAPTAACYGRIGTCTQEFGALASWLVDVLNTLTGNLDEPGGALFPRSAAGPAIDGVGRKGRIPYERWRSHVRELPEFGGELPAAAMAEEIDSAGDERLRAMVTLCGNPVLSTPNGDRLGKAFESLDFMVSIDIYLNETSRHADLILPGTGPLEHSHFDLAFAGFAVRNYARWSPPTFEAPEGSKHDWEILIELAARLTGTTAQVVDEMTLRQVLQTGLKGSDVEVEAAMAVLGDEPGPDRVVDAMLRCGPYGDRFGEDNGGLTLDAFREHPHGIDLGPLAPRLPALLRTESAKVELAPEILTRDLARLRERLADFAKDPLVLIGRRHLRSNNSWMHNLNALAKGPERCTLIVHPIDAERLGLADGAQATVRSRVGAVDVPVSISEEIRPGVVSLPHGWGHNDDQTAMRVARAHAGVNSNRLSDEAFVDVLSGNAVLNGIPVEVLPAGAAA